MKTVFTRKEIIHNVFVEIRELVDKYNNWSDCDKFAASCYIFARMWCLVEIGAVDISKCMLLNDIICRMLNPIDEDEECW